MEPYDNAQAGDASRYRATHCSIERFLAQTQVLCEALIPSEGLHEHRGLSYVLDWCADDQPFPLNVPGMISVPYAIELNDIALFVSKSLSGEDLHGGRSV